MSFIKTIIAFSLFVSAEASYAQQSNGYMEGFFLDYIITKDGDTIYGAVKEELFKAYILKINNDGTGSYTRYEADNLKGYRYNGYVTINKEPKDGIYTGLKAKKDSLDSAENDYIVKNNDTIYGDVYEPCLVPAILSLNRERK